MNEVSAFGVIHKSDKRRRTAGGYAAGTAGGVAGGVAGFGLSGDSLAVARKRSENRLYRKWDKEKNWAKRPKTKTATYKWVQDPSDMKYWPRMRKGAAVASLGVGAAGLAAGAYLGSRAGKNRRVKSREQQQ